MATQNFTVVCAWCHRIVRHGTVGADESHTICPDCAEWAMSWTPQQLFADASNRTDIIPPDYFDDRVV